MEVIVALITLSVMEIILGIDNIVFIAILASRLPADQQSRARKLGLIVAMVTRLLLLFSITWVLRMDKPLFYLTELGLPEWVLGHSLANGGEGTSLDASPINGISLKDLILLGGGLFLIWKSVREIHHKLEGSVDQTAHAANSFWGVVGQIGMMDVIFSIDSVITAVGMVNADKIWVMVVAILVSMGVMLKYADPISHFVDRHPTIKILALSFLILIGVMLVAEGIGTHFNKGFIYFAMAFSLVVEMINMRVRSTTPPGVPPLPPSTPLPPTGM